MRIAVAAVLLVVTVGACTDESKITTSDSPSTTGARTATTSTSTSTTTLDGDAPTPTAPASAPSTTPPSPLDWDGAKFDAGEIVAAQSDDAGLILVVDRWGYYDESGTVVSGPQLTEEPVVAFNTDSPWTNESTKTRRFRVAASANYLVMDRNPLATSCDGEEPPQPTWTARPLDSIRDLPGSDDALGAQTSFTYDANGLIDRIRISYAC